MKAYSNKSPDDVVSRVYTAVWHKKLWQISS